jgi:hypothetical protein
LPIDKIKNIFFLFFFNSSPSFLSIKLSCQLRCRESRAEQMDRQCWGSRMWRSPHARWFSGIDTQYRCRDGPVSRCSGCCAHPSAIPRVGGYRRFLKCAEVTNAATPPVPILVGAHAGHHAPCQRSEPRTGKTGGRLEWQQGKQRQ